MPKNSPKVVSPKANAGVVGNLEQSKPTLKGIVIEKSVTPSKDKSISESPNSKKGRAKPKLIYAVFLNPNKSADIPPRILPIPMAENNRIACHMLLFQEMGMA